MSNLIETKATSLSKKFRTALVCHPHCFASASVEEFCLKLPVKPQPRHDDNIIMLYKHSQCEVCCCGSRAGSSSAL